MRVLNERTLGYAEFRGNRQYVTTGNVAVNDRVSLFLMDYAHRRRLKIFGHIKTLDPGQEPTIAEMLVVHDYPAVVERAVVIRVEACDWNCPQHITPRFTEAVFADALASARTDEGQDRREPA